MDRVKRIWYLSPMRAAKVQASLRIPAVSPEPSLLAHTSSESRRTSDRKPDPWPLWMAGHAQLKFVMTECSKTQIRLTGLLWFLITVLLSIIGICVHNYWGRVKQICVFEHSVMTNFNCACPAIERSKGSGFLFEGSSLLTASMSEQRRFLRDCADAQARLNLRCSHRR